MCLSYLWGKDGLFTYSGSSIKYNNNGFFAGVGYRLTKWAWLISTHKYSVSFNFVGSFQNKVDYRILDLNQNDQIIGQYTDGGPTYLFQGTTRYDIPQSGQLSSPEEDEALMLLASHHLAIQKRDPQTGDLVPISDGADAYTITTVEQLLHKPDAEGNPTQNAEWSSPTFSLISDNGNFIAGNAIKNGVSHAVLWMKTDMEIHDENGSPQKTIGNDRVNIPVNGDFDEEKQVNGRYVRDYEDASIGFVNDSTDLKTDDLRGCVFDVPGLPDALWQNTALKIRRKAGVINPETSEEETGEIRIHAIDADNNWVEVPLDADLAPDFYAPDGQYKNYRSWWIEGIKDGPITIEMEVVVNGGTPITVEKKTMICTEKTKAEWLQELRDEMELLSGVDMNQFNPSNGFLANRPYLQAVYFYYEELFMRDLDYIWPGMAKMAGAPVYGGLSDAEYGDSVFSIPLVIAALGLGAGVEEVNLTNLSMIQTTLMEVNKAIYEDLAWQFKAYHTSGLCALEYAYVEASSDNNVTNINIWRAFDDAQESDYSLVQDANRLLLLREQSQIVVPGWNVIANLSLIRGSSSNFIPAREVFSIMAENPIPGGLDFRTVVPGGDITDFADRWAWIDDSSQGMWKLWTDFSILQQQRYVEIPLKTRAADYAWLPVK